MRQTAAYFFFFLGFALTSQAFPIGSSSFSGNGVNGTHFTASYYQNSGGYWDCTGQRLEKSGPKGKNFVKDSETCQISDIETLPAGHYNLQEFGNWASDYDYFVNGVFRLANKLDVTVYDNGNGTGTVELTAYYNY